MKVSTPIINKNNFNLFISNCLIFLFFLLLLLVLIFITEDCLFRTAYADDGSDSDEKPKVDKGKGKAVDTHTTDIKSKSSDSESDSEKNRKAVYKKQLELLDYEYAMHLQKQEDEASLCETGQSSPSVVSTVIHSDDSDTTKKRKLRLREIDKELYLEQGKNQEQINTLKRKHFDDEDGKPESSKKK